MGNVLIVFAKSLLDDLSERPGRNKLEKEKAAIPRIALQKILERLSREMQKDGGTAHLRADVFEEPFSTLRLYQPDSLAILLSNFNSLTPVPAKRSDFAQKQPSGYIATFHYERIGWMLLSAYLEVDKRPFLVFLRAANQHTLEAMFKRIAASPSEFDVFFNMAEEAAADAA